MAPAPAKTRGRPARWARRAAFALVALWPIWFLARASASDHWVIALVQSGAMYVLGATGLGLVIAICVRSRIGLLSGVVGLVCFGLLLTGRATVDRQPPAAGPRVTILALNLAQGQASATAVVGLVRERGVDVAALSELTSSAKVELERAGLRELLPQAQAVPFRGSGGLGAFSRLGSTWDDELLPPPRRWMPTVARPRGAAPFRFGAVHASPPLPKALADYRANRVFGELPAATYRGKGSIIAGDFNATLDGARLRELMDKGYRDAADEMGRGLGPTWRGARGLAALTIDHVLVPPGVAVRAYERIEVPGTDHDALLVTVQLPRDLRGPDRRLVRWGLTAT